MSFFMSDKKGFTLIELLVAVAIVSILASVVFGMLQEGRKKAHDAKRVSDLGQIQLALRLYKDANNGYPAYPTGEVIGDGSGLEGELASLFSNTIKDPLHDATTYQYVYDSDFDCIVAGTGKKVLYAKTMERVGAGNWATVCGGTPPGTDSYIVILQ